MSNKIDQLFWFSDPFGPVKFKYIAQKKGAD